MSRTKGSKNKKVLKKRGRPKGSKKVKRGRPKGSKNKVTKVKAVKAVKGKRGRPRKVTKDLCTEYIKPPKSYKFLGYCPKCNFIISKKELVLKTIFLCESCGKRATVKKLRRESKASGDVPKSKKEYLQKTIHVNYNDMAPMAEGIRGVNINIAT